MRRPTNSSFIGVVVLTVAGAAYGSQPADPVSSDSAANTAMGSFALLHLVSDSQNESGYDNTAAGNGALETPNSTMTGSFNSAFGAYALYSNTTGSANTAVGYTTLNSNTTGYSNTALGHAALQENTVGADNSALGMYALNHNQAGNDNTASGFQALYGNTSGDYNTASGFQALFLNSAGYSNTALGMSALYTNDNGFSNTAAGLNALYSNTEGNYNTGVGQDALFANAIGSDNSAFGYKALNSNTGSFNSAFGDHALFTNVAGANNTAVGYSALFANRGGAKNTAVGEAALHANTSGSNNIAIGYQAGFHLTTGSNNIDIGNPGVAGEPNTIRIGATQTATFIAGFSAPISGSLNALMISSTGQIGVKMSSERFKTDITAMGSSSEKLQRLRPVTFHYKSDATRTLEYGLIAEEVAKVYPELVIRGRNGKIDGVRYDELAPILLSEMQKQQRKIDAQARINEAQDARMRDLELRLAKLQAALKRPESKDELLAQR